MMSDENGPKGLYSRGYLPHIDLAGRTQFLTYRLADSVPKKVIDAYDSRRSRGEISDLEYYSFMERYLDRGVGECILANPEVATMVQENLLYHNGNKYQLHAWVVMPNHLHTLLTPFPGYTLAEIVHSCKSYTAKEANRILGRTGQIWFAEPFDRYIRSEKHFRYVWDYIDNNPVKAGFCEVPEEWRFSSAWYYFQDAVICD